MVIQTDFKITYHSFSLFNELLAANNLNFNIIERSLSPALNRKQVFSAGEGSGKSGSFFFHSHDKQFIIKTMKGAEKRAFIKILPEYVEYLRQNPYSMLAKIYGVFTLKRKYMKKVTVMLMENTIQTKNPKNLLSTYDLKGSTHGRLTKNKSKVKPTTVQKDLDFLDAKTKSKKMFELNALNRKLRAVML